MRSLGVTVRPLYNMAGVPGFNQVFFDNVVVPKKDLLGEENMGWYYATKTLDFERSSIGAAMAQRNLLEDILELVRSRKGPLGQVPEPVRWELADRAIETEVARLLCYRVVTLQAKGIVPNYEASTAKLYASELAQRVARTGLKALGLFGLLDRSRGAGADAAANRWAPLRGRLMRNYLWSVAATIAGGTSEIQRNIIAIRGLGLPRG